MKRDMNLIRDLLFRFEAAPKIYSGKKFFQIAGRPESEIDLHLKLLEDAGFIERPTPARSFAGGAIYEIGMRLTHAGYDLLDSIRDPDIWEKTQKGMKDVGGFTFDLVKDLAKGFIKQKIKHHTGVEL